MHVLHAARGIRARLPVPQPDGAAELRRDRPPGADFRRAWGGEDPADRGRAARAPGRPQPHRATARYPRPEGPDADYEWLAAASAGAKAEGCRPRADYRVAG